MAVAKIGELTYETLADAITAANSIEGDVTITLIADIEFNSKCSITKNLIIDGAYTLTRATSYVGNLFTVSSGVTLTLKDFTVDGNNNWVLDAVAYDEALYSGTRVTDVATFITLEDGAPVATADLIIVSGSVITDGVTICNNAGTAAGGIFTVNSGATLTTKDTVITHIYSSSNNVVASVTSGGTWTIETGTEISDCYAGGNGGISRCDGHLIMNGGTIENNKAVNANGTVFMFYGSSSYFETNDGIIRGNSGCIGKNNGRNAAIYMHSKSTMVMNGGVIEVNVGWGSGGIDAPYTDGRGSTVTIYDGAVINNVAVSGGNTGDIRGSTEIIIYGGTFTQNVSEWCAEDYAVVQFADGTWGVKTILFQAYAQVDGIIYKADMYTCMNGVIYKVKAIQSRLDIN